MSEYDPVKLGVVAHCENLNVRALPDPESEIICVIPGGTEVMINEEKSTDEFFKVYTAAGIEGFCNRNYISV